MGNIVDDIKIRDILGKEGLFLSEKIGMFSPDKIEKCKDCDVSWFCWSCIKRIDNLTEKEFDERCSAQKKRLGAVWD
ncbi:MAG: hypothetical protein K5769_10605 [Pseudobutyrivibrio sp.]|nr:hypothetical protein [Pseudobutyrivibrio sp.]